MSTDAKNLADRPVLAHAPLLNRVLGGLPTNEPPEPLVDGVPLLGVRDVMDGQAQQFIGRVPRERAVSGIHAHQSPGERVRVRLPDPGALEGGAELLLARSKRPPRPPAAW